MKVLVGFAVSVAAIILAFSAAPPGRALGQFNKDPLAKADQPPAQDAKETRLLLDDIRALRGKRKLTDRLVEMAAEQGRAFELPFSQSPQAKLAERWSLVGLLNQQPVKFGKLLAAMKQPGADPVASVEKIYGWDEKEFSRQWRVYATSLGKRTAPEKRN